MTITSRTRSDRSPARRVGIGLTAVAAALALGIGAVATWAAFTDHGALNTTVTGQSMLGGINGLGGGNATVYLPENNRLTATFDNEAPFVPGSTAKLVMPLFNNNSADIPIALDVTGLNVAGPNVAGGETGVSTADYFVFSAEFVPADTTIQAVTLFGDPDDPEGGVVAAEVGVDTFDENVPVLNSRDYGPYATDGGEWTAGPADSYGNLIIYAHLVDDSSFTTADSGSATITVTVEGRAQ